MSYLRFISKPTRLLALLAVMFSLTSCEKEVNIDLGTSPTQIVVQGAIETNLPPYVLLTSTISFFATVDLATLEKSFIHGADVRVSDGSRSVTLKEYALDTGANNKFFIYSLDTTSLIGGLMIGENGKTYTLTITYEGKTYSSTTKLAAPSGPDTLWFGKPAFLRETTPDSAQQLYLNYSDPDTPGNYVRCFTSRNGDQFYPTAIFSDEVINGKKVNNISISAGYDESNPDIRRDSIIYFYPGDTVTLKWAGIDKAVYKFWNTYQFALNSVGNPFSSPINVQTNITNGALGVWAGYASNTRRLVVPR